jgi:transcription-repair coupling factor (superfamily II helicase)
MAREFKDRFGPLPQPVENLLCIVKIKVLAAQAGVNSISTQGKQIVIKSRESVIASVAKQSLIKGYGAAVKVGTTQIKLDTRLPGKRWTEVLEEILSSNCS